jgi:hypothetical protein
MKKLITALLTLILSIKGFSQKQSSAYDPYVAAVFDYINNKPFIPLQLEDTSGRIFNTSSLVGKTIYVDFWFISCPPCLKEIPLFKISPRVFCIRYKHCVSNICIEDPERKRYVLFFNGNSALNKVSKVLNIPRSNLITTSGQTIWFYLNNPIMIATWDVQKMGDQWKYIVNGLDPGTVTTQTKTVSSKFGANFQFDATIAKIVKIGLGITGEQTYTQTTQIQVTTGSDFCGEAIVSFANLVITGTTTIIWKHYYIQELNTGSVSLGVEPRKIQ